MTKPRSSTAGLRGLACLLTLTTTLVCSLQTGASAMLAPASVSAPAASAAPARDADLRVVQKTLESKILRHRLHELGLSDAEIQSRLNKLSDAQVHQLALRIHALNPAGDVSIFGILLIAVLVLLVIYLIKRI